MYISIDLLFFLGYLLNQKTITFIDSEQVTLENEFYKVRSGSNLGLPTWVNKS